MIYIYFFQIIISLLLTFTLCAMELYKPTKKQKVIIHTPIAHLRSLEGKERKEFINENRGNITAFIQKITYNNEKLRQKRNNIKGTLLLCSGAMISFGSGNSLLNFFQKPPNTLFDYFKASGFLIGTLTGIGLFIYGTKKSYDNSFTVVEEKIRKNQEVLRWLRNNGDYHEK